MHKSKKKSLLFVAASVLSCLMASSASATEESDPASGFYAGGGVNVYFVDKGDAASGMPAVFVDQPTPAAILGRVGYSFNDYLAVEVEAGFGGSRSEFEGGTSRAEVGAASPYGVHAALSVPIGQSGGYLLGKAGYSGVTIEREFNGQSVSDLDISGASFGIGGGLRQGSFDFRAEYTFMSGDANAGALGVFLLRRF